MVQTTPPFDAAPYFRSRIQRELADGAKSG